MGVPYKTPYIPPTFKGTIFFAQKGAGSSESLFAAPPTTLGGFTLPLGQQAGAAPTTYQGMQQAMLAVLPERLKLSQTQSTKDLVCTNPLTVAALRIDNEQQARATLLVNSGIPVGPSFAGRGGGEPLQTPGADTNQIDGDNDIEAAAYHIQLSDGNGHTAGSYLHGVPVASEFAMGLPSDALGAGASPFDRGIADINPAWSAQMLLFCNALVRQGLGFRFAYPTWSVAGQPSGLYPTLGNGSPALAFYGLPGTPSQCYSFLMAGFDVATAGKSYQQWLSTVGIVAPVPSTPVLGKMIVVVRGMKQLRVLNGRYPAIGQFLPANIGGQTNPAGYYVSVQRRAPDYLATLNGTYDNNGYLAPLAWSVVQPLPGGAPLVTTPAQPPGIQVLELTTKKVGRVFGSPRGRARNRVT